MHAHLPLRQLGFLVTGTHHYSEDEDHCIFHVFYLLTRAILSLMVVRSRIVSTWKIDYKYRYSHSLHYES